MARGAAQVTARSRPLSCAVRALVLEQRLFVLWHIGPDRGSVPVEWAVEIGVCGNKDNGHRAVLAAGGASRAKRTAEQALDGEQDGAHIVDGRPLLLQCATGLASSAGFKTRKGHGKRRHANHTWHGHVASASRRPSEPAYLQNIQADVAVLVNIWMEARGDKSHLWCLVRVAGGEFEPEFECQPFVDLWEQSRR